MMKSYDHEHKGILDLGWGGLGESLEILVTKIAQDYHPEAVVGIAKGGVIPAVVISSAFLVDFFPIKLSRRRKEIVVSEDPIWFVKPTRDVEGLSILLVDDITVSGAALRTAKEALIEYGAREVKTATLAVHSGSTKPDFYAIETEDLILMPWDKNIFTQGRWEMNAEYAKAIEEIDRLL